MLALMPPDVRRALEKMKSLYNGDLGVLEGTGARICSICSRPCRVLDDRKCLPLLASHVEAEIKNDEVAKTIKGC